MSAFLDKLPAEVRLQIYADVLRSTGKCIRRFMPNMSYYEHIQMLDVSILRVNRRIHIEATAVLYEVNRFRLAPCELCAHVTANVTFASCDNALLEHAIVRPQMAFGECVHRQNSYHHGAMQPSDYVKYIKRFDRQTCPRLKSVTLLLPLRYRRVDLSDLSPTLKQAGMQVSFTGVGRAQVAVPGLAGVVFTLEYDNLATAWDWAISLIRQQPDLNPNENLTEPQLAALPDRLDPRRRYRSKRLSVMAIRYDKEGRAIWTWRWLTLLHYLEFEWLQQQETWTSETFAQWTAQACQWAR